MLASMQRQGRLRPAAAEISLAFAGLLAGVIVMTVLSFIGLIPRSGPWERAYGFIGGPAITVIAAAVYASLARALDDGQEHPARLEPVEEPMAVHRLRPSILATLAGIALAVGGSMALGQLMQLIGLPVEEQSGIVEIVDEFERGGARLEVGILAVSAVILAPLAEEWLFRGLLFARVRSIAGRSLAFGASALAFAAIHGNPAGFVIYTWLGFVFAYTFERTGRLGTAVAVHMANNAFALVVMLTVAPPGS